MLPPELKLTALFLTPSASDDGQLRVRDAINAAAKVASLAEPSKLVNGNDILFEHCRFPSLDALQFVLNETHEQNAQVHKVVGDARAITTLLKQGPSGIRSVRVSSSCVMIVVAEENLPRDNDDSFAEVSASMEEICGVVLPCYSAAEPVFGALPLEGAIALTEWRVNDHVTLVCLAENQESSVALFRGIDHLPENTGVFCEASGNLLAVTAIDIHAPVKTQAFDAWLACCLHGSPTCLVFFFDEQVCKGVDFIYAIALPYDLPRLVEKYTRGQPCLHDGYSKSACELPMNSVPCFETQVWRERATEFVLQVAQQDGDSSCGWKALLFYRAAVRLAQAHKPVNLDPSSAGDVPQGVRWTALSMGSPLRVRQYMVKALRSAPEHFTLLRASALEFHADSYLALPGDDREKSLREVLRSLGQSMMLLAGAQGEGMQKRIVSKLINAQIMLAKSYQCASPSRYGEAIALVDKVLAMETNVLLCASFSHLKAVLLREFVLQLQAQEEERDFFLEQARYGELDDCEPKLDPERWLSSSITLCLRSVRLAESHPLAQTVVCNAKATIALSYTSLGQLYASNGRYTKCQILAKQGIELFSATGDWEQVLKLQVWQGIVRLGWIQTLDECSMPTFLSPSLHASAEQIVERVEKAMSPVDDACATKDLARIFISLAQLSLAVSVLDDNFRVFCNLSQPLECLDAIAILASKKADFDAPPEFTAKVAKALQVIGRRPGGNHHLGTISNFLLGCIQFPRAMHGHGPSAARARRICMLHLQKVQPRECNLSSCVFSLGAVILAAKLCPPHQRVERLCAAFLEVNRVDLQELANSPRGVADGLFRQEIHDAAIQWLKSVHEEQRVAAKQAYGEVITSWQLHAGPGRPKRDFIENLMKLAAAP